LYHNLDSPDWDGEDLIRKEEIYILMLMKTEKYQITWNPKSAIHVHLKELGMFH